MSIWLILALQASAVPDAPAKVPRPLIFLAVPRCTADRPGDGEVVVCGTKRDLYRLPLPNERVAASGPIRGEAPTGMMALTPPGRCGIFSGERACSKREAARYGYGGGRDPVTLLTRLARAAADPDAD